MLTGDAQQMHGKPKIVITDYDYGDVSIETEILEAAGAQVIALQVKTEKDLAEVAGDCFGMMNQYAPIGAETIARMQICKVIARYGVDVDIVDVEAASNKGILATNVRDYCTEEVADHAIALWLTLARKLPAYDKATRAGVWRWQSGAPLNRIRGRSTGIVFFGKINQAIADRARALGVALLVYDPYICAEKISAKGARSVSKDELLREAGFLLMQAPMTSEAWHFLSHREFEIMKSSAIVVNTGRGPTIDNKALDKALTENQIAAAGLDDPEEEPAKRASWSPDENPIFRLANVIVTPHAAYYSEESIQRARTLAANEVASVLLGGSPKFPVNAEAVANRG
jgi:D-3-phosphoglycerate dehydrogenase